MEWKKEIDFFYKLSDCLSHIDMLCSLADYAAQMVSCVTKPFFCDDLVFAAASHPILKNLKLNKEQDSNENLVISNDIEASSKSPFNLIMGANTSGKSTIIKQIALLQIMAQCKCKFF
jgi:DNA mismatch repair protein MSH4